MIDSTFIEALTEHLKTEVVSIDGKQYATKAVFTPPLPNEPLVDALAVSTLTGFVDFVKANPSGDVLHVRNYHEVAHLGPIGGVRRMRDTFIIANCGAPLFKFGQFMPHVEFMIGIQSQFLDYGDRAKVMKTVGTIKDQQSKTSNDDGVTQQVTASAGIALSQEVALPNPVILKPFRTFTEINQPPSQFVLRVQPGKNGALPEVALFEADGGRWKHEAIINIREYLRAALPEVVIIA